MLSRLGRAGRWWLALGVVCAVGLAVVALGLGGRAHPGHDPAGHTAAPSVATQAGAGRPTATPAGSVSPSPVQAGLISSAPPSPAASSAPRPAPSPRPSPRPAPSPSPSPAPYLILAPASGAATLTPTWSASACPSGYQTSAVLFELNTDGSIASRISAAVSGVSTAFTGLLDGPVSALITDGSDVLPGGTSTWVVGCFAGTGGTGAQKLAQSAYVTLSADGSSYTSSATAPG